MVFLPFFLRSIRPSARSILRQPATKFPSRAFTQRAFLYQSTPGDNNAKPPDPPMSFRFSLPESNKAAERPEIDSHQLSPETGREEGSTATSELSEPQDVEKDPNEKYIAVAQLNPPQDDESRRYGVPSMEITFTCKPCYRRSTHRISKHGYFKGSVLITCPNCKARHVITDHLKIFSERGITLEDILKKNGETLQTGTVDMEGDMEFWDDETNTHVVSPDEFTPDEGSAVRY